MRYILLLALLAIPTLADTTIRPGGGLTNWEMYVLGGASVFFDLFTSINFFVNSSGFYVLATFVALCGFMVLMIKNISGLDPKMIGMYFIAIWGVSFATFNLKVDLTIIDSVGSNPADTSRVITGVPASVGLPAAWISDLGESFTNMVESNFSHVDSRLKFSNTKTINMEAKLLKDAMTIHPFSPELTKSMGEFYKDCVFPILANGNISLSQILGSNDFATEIVPHLNPAIQTVDYTTNGAGEVKGCREAWDGGSNNYETQINDSIATIAGTQVNFGPNRQNIDNAGIASGSMSDLVGAILSTVSHSSATTDASTLVKSRSLARSFYAGTKGAASGSDMDVSALPELLIEEQALSQQTEGWRMAISAFNAMAIYIFTVLHAFIIGVSPIILILAFLPGVAGKTVLNYLQVLFWLTLWQPMLSIVNYIVVSFQNNTLATLLNTANTDYMSPSEPMAWRGINDALDNYTLAAGFLGTMVPMISWGILKGGMNFSQFISSGIGTSVAQGAAKNLATGTLSMDNKSFNNTSANKFSTVDSIATGQQLSSFGQTAGNANVSKTDRGGYETQHHGNAYTIDTNAETSRVSGQALNYGKAAQRSQGDSVTDAHSQLFQAQRAASQRYQHALQHGTDAQKAEALQNLQSVNSMIDRSNGTSGGEKIATVDQATAKKNTAALGAAMAINAVRDDDGAIVDLAKSDPEEAKELLNTRFENRYENDDLFRHTVDKNAKAAYPELSKEEAVEKVKNQNTNEAVEWMRGNDDGSGEMGKQIAASVAQAGVEGLVSASKEIPLVGRISKATKAVMDKVMPRVEFAAQSTSNTSSEVSADHKALKGDSSQQAEQANENLTKSAKWAENFSDEDMQALSHLLNEQDMKTFQTARQNIIQQSKGYQDKLEYSQSLKQSIGEHQHMTPQQRNELMNDIQHFTDQTPELGNVGKHTFTKGEYETVGDDEPKTGALDFEGMSEADATDGNHEGENSVREAVAKEIPDADGSGRVKADYGDTNPADEITGIAEEIQEGKNRTGTERAVLAEDVLSKQLAAQSAIDTVKSGGIIEAAKSDTLDATRQTIDNAIQGGVQETVGDLSSMSAGDIRHVPLDEEFQVGEYTSNSAMIQKNDDGTYSSNFVYTKGEGENAEQYVFDSNSGVMVPINDDSNTNYVPHETRDGEFQAFKYYGEDLNGNDMYMDSKTDNIVSGAQLRQDVVDGKAVELNDNQLEDAYGAYQKGKQAQSRNDMENQIDDNIEKVISGGGDGADLALFAREIVDSGDPQAIAMLENAYNNLDKDDYNNLAARSLLAQELGKRDEK